MPTGRETPWFQQGDMSGMILTDQLRYGRRANQGPRAAGRPASPRKMGKLPYAPVSKERVILGTDAGNAVRGAG